MPFQKYDCACSSFKISFCKNKIFSQCLISLYWFYCNFGEWYRLRAPSHKSKKVGILLMIFDNGFIIFLYSFSAITLPSDFQVQIRCVMVYQMEIMPWQSIRFITRTTSCHAVIILHSAVHVLLLILLLSTVKRVINACLPTMLVSNWIIRWDNREATSAFP